LALVYCELGENEKAVTLLEEALNIGDAWITWIVVDPQLDSLRSDPRYKELMQRTNNPYFAHSFNATLPAND
jgi:hypothetical protein